MDSCNDDRDAQALGGMALDGMARVPDDMAQAQGDSMARALDDMAQALGVGDSKALARGGMALALGGEAHGEDDAPSLA